MFRDGDCDAFRNSPKVSYKIKVCSFTAMVSLIYISITLNAKGHARSSELNLMNGGCDKSSRDNWGKGKDQRDTFNNDSNCAALQTTFIGSLKGRLTSEVAPCYVGNLALSLCFSATRCR